MSNPPSAVPSVAQKSALVRAARAVDRADDKALTALFAAYPRGREVSWEHGQQTRTATVVEIRGLTYGTARLYVESRLSGKRYDVPVSAVVSYLKVYHG